MNKPSRSWEIFTAAELKNYLKNIKYTNVTYGTEHKFVENDKGLILINESLSDDAIIIGFNGGKNYYKDIWDYFGIIYRDDSYSDKNAMKIFRVRNEEIDQLAWNDKRMTGYDVSSLSSTGYNYGKPITNDEGDNIGGITFGDVTPEAFYWTEKDDDGDDNYSALRMIRDLIKLSDNDSVESTSAYTAFSKDMQEYNNYQSDIVAQVEREVKELVEANYKHIYDEYMSAKALQQDSIDNKMQKFKTQLDLVNTKFNYNRAIYTMYLNFLINDSVVLIDTNSKDWVENCLINFEHDQIGPSGQFTINILFKQNERSMRMINELEIKLMSICNIYKDNDTSTLKNTLDLYYNCKYKYGYGDESNIRSDWYLGMISGYDSKITNGNLEYTIKGYSTLMSQREVRLSPKPEYSKFVSEVDGKEYDVANPLLYINRIFEVEFNEVDENNQNYRLYGLRFLSNIDITDNGSIIYPSGDYKLNEQKNLFEVINDILAGTTTKDEYKRLQLDQAKNTQTYTPIQKQIFNYYIDDRENSEYKLGCVYIYKMPSYTINEDTGTEMISSNLDMPFTYFGACDNAYNHMIVSWEPNFDGQSLRCLATNLVNGTYTDLKALDNNGNIISVLGLGAVRTGVTDSNEMITSVLQEYSNWAFVTQYPYNAKLTILGVPAEIPFSAVIKVLPIMGANNGDQLIHHSQGFYFVTGRIDKLSASGYTTELSLTKLTPGFKPEYTESSSDAYAIEEKTADEQSFDELIANKTAEIMSSLKSQDDFYTHYDYMSSKNNGDDKDLNSDDVETINGMM